jgi:hypothetical protein
MEVIGPDGKPASNQRKSDSAVNEIPVSSGRRARNARSPELAEETLWRTSHAMARWASERGKTPSIDVIRQLESRRHGPPGMDAASIHRQLSELVYPARPQTIARIMEERDRMSRSFLGRVALIFGSLPIVRWLLLLTIVALIAFVAFASTNKEDGSWPAAGYASSSFVASRPVSS